MGRECLCVVLVCVRVGGECLLWRFDTVSTVKVEWVFLFSVCENCVCVYPKAPSPTGNEGLKRKKEKREKRKGGKDCGWGDIGSTLSVCPGFRLDDAF